MSFLKAILRVTPLRVSFAIALVFAFISIVYDIFPKQYALVATIADKSIDYKFEIRGLQRPRSKIVIVAGDEKAFQTYGQWPFDRGTVFAPLLETICGFNPKAVGLDIVWAEHEKAVPDTVKEALANALGPTKGPGLDSLIENNSGDGFLARAVRACGNKIVLGYALNQSPEEGLARAEYEKRLKLLLDSGRNVLTAKLVQPIRFPENRGDPRADVKMDAIARSGLLNIPSITPPGVAQGFFNNESDSDSDGNYRHAIFFYKAGDAFVPSLALRMAQKALDPADTQPQIFIRPEDSKQGAADLKIELITPEGRRRIPVDLAGQAIVNYRGPNGTFPNVSIPDVLSASETIEYDQVEPGTGVKHYRVHKTELFRDALVFLGITANAIYDVRPRPLDPHAAGVENHASILDNLLNDDFLVRPTSEWMVLLLLGILASSLIFGLAVSKLNAALGAAFSAVTIAAVLYLDQIYLFEGRGVVFSGHLQAIQLLFQYVAITLIKYMREESEKRFIRSAFDKYVSPAIIDSMLKDPRKLKLGGEKKDLTVLFSDIRGFTELSERVDVKTLTQFLNEYLGTMTEILQKHSGTLDKYIGDAVMGFWSAPIEIPGHEMLAVRAALEMVTRLAELNHGFQAKYGFTIDIGIGINTGPVSVGNFGSSRVFEYTVIGDNVNLASRLEGINKVYGTHVIVSESTFQKLKPGEFLAREVDTVRVKGKAKPVKIYEVFPDNEAHAPLKSSLKAFQEGLSLYYARKWERALSFFQTVLRNRDGDRATLELIERCNEFLANPPAEDWDGSWEMRTK